MQGYLGDVLAGKRVVGQLERKYVERHFRDLVRASSEERDTLRFNEERAFHVLEFAERYIVHTKAEWARRPYRFTDRSSWIAALFWIGLGWESWDPEDQAWRRRFQTIYVSVARKNGKTLIAAILAAYFGAFDQEDGAEVYFFAPSKDQAKYGWKQVKACIRLCPDPEYRALFECSGDSIAQIGIPDTDSFIRAVASDSDNLDGLNPHLAIGDELHKQKTGDLVDVMKSGMGARREPMLFLITTAGSKRQGVCWDYDHTTQRLLNQLIYQDDFLGFIARLDPEDAWDDEKAWAKANPNLGEGVKLSKLRKECLEAKNTPARLREFKQKKLNLWTEQDFSWLPIEKWDACEGEVRLLRLRRQRCFLGVDLSATSDYTAVVAVFPRPDGRILVKAWLWIPKDTLFERAKTDRVDVVRWSETGIVIPTEGPVVDQDAIKGHILRLRRAFNVIEIPMDPANATNLQSQLLAVGAPVITFQQGWVTMSPAIKEAETLIKAGKLVHDGNEALRWMFGNVALRQDDARDNRSFHKGRSADRIDGPVAMVMGIGRAAVTQAFRSVYEGRGIREA